MKDTLFLASILLFGCTGLPTPIESPDPTTAPSLRATDYPGLQQCGFDARSDDATWCGDDAVVFALCLRKGTEVHRWLLRLEVLIGEDLLTRVDDGEAQVSLWGERVWAYTVTEQDRQEERQIRSRMLPVTVKVADEHGKLLTNSLVQLPSGLLGRGILPAVDAALAEGIAAGDAAAGKAASEPIVAAILGTMALLNVVQEDDALASYFWQVVEKPSVWSVLTSLGARATMSMPFERSVRVAQVPEGLPAADRAYLVPLCIDVNGSPALLADVLTIEAKRPYALCGGMVAAVARHPSRPDLTFELQLVSAQLGKPTQRAKVLLDDVTADKAR